jgi:multidrug transporter EmrE-like cation transporter
MNVSQPVGMRSATHVFLLLAVATLQCVNQLLLKRGVSRGGPIPLSWPGLVSLVVRVVTTPEILAGYAVGFLTGLVWLATLSRMEISFASPVVTGIYFILLVVGAWALLGEGITATRVLGMLLILGGLLLIFREG